MTLFWIITAAMILAALALLAPALLRSYGKNSDATEQLNIEIAREHLDELVKQKASGDLSDEEFNQAKQDLEIALAQDLEGTTTAAAAPTRTGGKIALLIAAILVPAITVPLYLEIGSPHLIESMPGNDATTAGHGEGQLPPVNELVQQLRERMEANPENAEGWFLLGRTYMRLQNYPDAVYAYEKVVALLPNESAALLSLADAMAMRDGRRVGSKAKELLLKALSIDPDAVTAMWLLGNAAFDEGDNATALKYWKQAYPLLGQEPAMQSELAQRITQAGGTPPAATEAPSFPPIMPPPVASPAAAPAQVAAAQDRATASDGAAISVEVALAAELIERVEPGDTVFVLARAETGPPMPLAVARHRAGELPLKVTLTDAMAMMPAMKLSSFPRVKVSAKISKSGQAGSQPGDMVASDVVVDSTQAPESVQLLINRVIE